VRDCTVDDARGESTLNPGAMKFRSHALVERKKKLRRATRNLSTPVNVSIADGVANSMRVGVGFGCLELVLKGEAATPAGAATLGVN